MGQIVSLGYLLESFLVNKAIRYDIKGKKYINTLSKYYFSDIGLRNAILNMRQQEKSHIIVVKDHIMPRRKEDGILTIGLFDFLLKKDSLDL